MQLNTFSIAARCPRTGMLGVAVSTAVPAVGALCPHVRPGVGAVTTQSWVNPYLGFEAIDRLGSGAGAQEVLEGVLAGDDAKHARQLGIVDARGGAASWSGEDCTPWFGHRTGPGYAIQGNMLTGPEVVDRMEAALLGSEASELAERLLLALEAGQAAGGDKRGKQSAALLVYHEEDYPWVDLRVDEHRHPVPELRRIWTIFLQQVRPFLTGMPKRGQPAGAAPEAVTSLLLTPPPYRPGGGGSA
ncbi:DUF1028 domain-containing protein [Paracraurococcus lichenis]|uniref:DUF1028 domain-containing protein n=1 Tax=Paracraurococcus lichenis TaxID=3064888 RepID=A0ABT9E3M2_9PROT|nr:DUF1028 domain-containing protein [Paracraurococcus sp. LOR1-02]MDO9710761.1 DUF1028 domain-containing protein [Paracraurococcus sp. LOR1-02]